MARKTSENSKSSPIKVGIVGLGRAGYGMHLTDLKARSRKFQIVAACDPLAQQRQRFAEACPKAKVYKTFEELLNDKEVELVSVANRTNDHFATAMAALKKRKYVFLEKPICLTYDEAKKLKQSSQRSGKLFIRHNRRFEPAFMHAKEIIASGILGDVFEIKLARHSYQRRDDWQTLISEGGGQLNNWGPHLIDHALQFLNYEVSDMWVDLKKVAAVGDAEDHLKIIFRGKTGLVVDVEISGGVALPSPVYAIYGTKGSLISHDEKTFVLKYLNPRAKLKPRRPKKGTPLGFSDNSDLKWVEKTIPVKPSSKLEMASIWDFMHDEIRNGKKSPITVAQAADVVKYTEMARNQSGYYKN